MNWSSGAASQPQFVLHCQPQLDAAALQAMGVKALLRWHKPGAERAPPDEVIALAEELGLPHEIGDWALQTACQNKGRWRHRAQVLPSSQAARCRGR